MHHVHIKQEQMQRHDVERLLREQKPLLHRSPDRCEPYMTVLFSFNDRSTIKGIGLSTSMSELDDRSCLDGHTPLIRAVMSDDIEAVRYLIAKHADVQCMNADGRTPLTLASTEAMASMLLAHGAEPNQTDEHGRTALSYAVERRAQALIRLFLDQGAQVNQADSEGRTPLIWAVNVMNDSSDSSPTDLSVNDPSYSVLKTVDQLDCDIVQDLCERGADPNHLDMSGNTALSYAFQSGEPLLASLCLPVHQ
jgi:ankyrin repeat protein